MGRYLTTGKSLIRLGWKDGKDLFSVTGCVCVTHCSYVLFVVFFLAGLIRTGLSSSVKRQLAITLFILSLCTWLVDGWGLPPLIRSLCKVNYCQAPLRLACFLLSIESIHFFLRKLKIVLFRPRLPLCFTRFSGFMRGKVLKLKNLNNSSSISRVF